jgi:hypothetical protein
MTAAWWPDQLNLRVLRSGVSGLLLLLHLLRLRHLHLHILLRMPRFVSFITIIIIIGPEGEDQDAYAKAFATLDLEAVKKDLSTLMTTSQDWYVSDPPSQHRNDLSTCLFAYHLC